MANAAPPSDSMTRCHHEIGKERRRQALQREERQLEGEWRRRKWWTQHGWDRRSGEHSARLIQKMLDTLAALVS